MFTRFDTNKSTKGASKLRRDLINAEVTNLRDLLPLPQSTRQRLSQLQLMALVCVYVRKANYFQQVFKRHDVSLHQAPTPNIGFSKALSGFLMMLTQNGKLLYISDNAAEYLGHSMEDLLIHGDSVYDIIDKQDHGAIQAELGRSVPPQQGGVHAAHHGSSPASLEGERRMFLCRMNVSRNARRQMRFGDQKVVLVQGHYLSYLPLCSRNEPVFLATCTPIAMPETRECVVQGATNVFTTIHSMDMKIVHVDKNGEFHLGYSRNELQGVSWYQLLHWDSTREAQSKHRLITQSEQDRSCILLVQMQCRNGDFVWVHVVLQVRDSQDASQQPVIVCTNQVLSDPESTVMLANSWLYHYYSVQSKIQFGIQYEGPPPPQQTALTAVSGGPRVPSTAASAFYHSPNASSSIPSPGFTHPYVTTGGHPHMPAYGYHSPVGLGAHHGSPGLVGGGGGQHHQHHSGHHQQQQQQHHNNNNNNSHHSNNNGHNGNNGNNGNGGEHYRPYAYRIDAVQPVDYSSQPPSNGDATPLATNTTATPTTGSTSSSAEPRCTSNGSSSGASNGTALMPQHHVQPHAASRSGASPPSKRRAIARLEPLYIPAESRLADHHSGEEPTILELQPQALSHSNSGGADATSTGSIDGDNVSGNGGATVLLTTVIPPSFGRSARYYPTKSGAGAQLLPLAAAVGAATMAGDPTDFMDQWNPSPPWSETAQKVPDVMTQELSPYMTTTTPPTPTSAPPMVTAASSSAAAAAAASVSAAAPHTAVHTYAAGPAFSFDWMPAEQFVPVMDCGGAVTMAPASAYLGHHHLHQPQQQQQQHDQQQQQQHQSVQQHQQQQHHQQQHLQQQQQPQHLQLMVPQHGQYAQQTPQTQVTVVTVSTTAAMDANNAHGGGGGQLPPMPVSMHLQMSHWPAAVGVDQRMIGTPVSVGGSSSTSSSHSGGGGSYGHQSLGMDGRHPEEEMVGEHRDHRRSH